LLPFVVVALLALPASANAVGLPEVGSGQVTPLLKPSGVAFDPYTGDAWVARVGPPPAVVRFHRTSLGLWVPAEVIDLPSLADPTDLYFSPVDGKLIVVDAEKNGRLIVVCIRCHVVVDTVSLDSAVKFPTAVINGFKANVLTDFGDGTSAGSLWSGPRFATRLPLPDTITPSGIALLAGVGRVVNDRIPSQFLIIDANNNKLVRFSDASTPALLGTVPGPPGASGLKPPRDVAVDPLNLASLSGAAIHPILVPDPDLGNVFWEAPLGGTWHAISATPLGRPARVAASCNALAVTDFTNGTVSFFKQTPPRQAHCEDLLELLVEGGAPLSELALGMKALADAQKGRVSLWFTTPSPKARNAGGAVLARRISAPAKRVRLRAGRVTHVQLRFSRQSLAAIRAALRRSHRLFGTIAVRVTGAGGETATVSRQIRLTG
jgi:DNA-binding beta-propeller fold protein YncE